MLELVDDFTGPLARPTAATMLFKRALNDLDGTALKVDRALKQTTASGSSVSREFDNGTAAIDRYSGRLGLAAQALAALGPAALPIAAVAIPAVTGLADALGVTVLAGGTAVLALQGVGDALSKLNAAQLDPTAAHLKAAQLAFETLTPKAREFVLQMDAAAPALEKLKQSAGSGLLPGLSAALSGALTQLPKARGLLEGVSDALGNLGEMTGDSLASGAWGDFIDFLTQTAPPAIESLGHTVGNLAHGLASLWMAFDPLNTSVIGMLESGSQAFEDWAAALSQTEGFRDFVSYLQTSGPQVASALGSIGNAVLQIVEAIAPLGGPSLRIIEALADAIGTIADSPIGTPLLALVAAMSALSLATRGYEAVRVKAFGSPAVTGFKATTSSLLAVTSAQERATLSAGALARAESERAATARGGLATLGKQAGAMAGLALVSSGAADSLGLSNTAMLGLAGSIGGPPGAAIGAAAGALLDLKAAGSGATDALRSLDAAAASGNIDLLAERLKKSREELADYNNLDFNAGDILQRIGTDIGNVSSGRFSDQSDEYQASIDKNAAKLEELSAKARIAGQAQSELENYTSGVNRALYDQEAALAATVKAMEEQRAEAAKSANAELNYQSAILDAKDALKENGATSDKTTREGIANRKALYGLATAWNAQSDAAKNAKGSLKDARANFLETADAMKVPQAEAQRLAKRLFEIPEKRVTTVTIEDAATQKLIGIRNELASIKDKSVYVGVRGPGVGGMGPQLRATGGYISGPGSATSDSIPARLSNGEYVIQAKAVERYGVAMFDHLNAQRFASGGLVSKPLFTDEGPHFYKAAYRHNKPFAKLGPASWPSPYQTTLTPEQEALFEAWVSSAGVPFDPFSRLTDYDMRGFWKRTQGAGWAQGSHFPDTYKTPYDTTFSHESKYATANNPFYWHGNSLIDQRNGQVVFAADGATVPKTGRGYADRHLYMLADGEEVISNRYGQADRFRSDRASGRIPGYADGGTTGKKKAGAGRRATRALGNLDVDLSVDAEGASDAFAKFTDDVDHVRDLFKDAGRKWTKSLDDQTDTIRKSARQFDTLNTSLTTARNDRASYAASVGGSLGGPLFGNGLAGFQAAADANTADYSAAQGGLAAAIANGLDGPLRDALAESGDINALKQFGGLTAGQIDAEEQRYARLQNAQSGFGNTAAAAKFDSSIASYAAELKRNTAAIERLEKRLPGAVRDGARDGTHSGTTQANKSANTATTQDARTGGRGGGHRGKGH